MRAIKKTVSIPEDLCRKATKISSNFSETVTIALEDYLYHLKIRKALESFGQWEKREKDSIALVNQLRSEEHRNYVNRSD